MLLYVIIGLLILDIVVLIVSIVLQPRGQGGLGAAFGGAFSANTLFGGKGGMEFLTKLTAVLSLVFVALIMALNFYIASGSGKRSLMQRSGTPVSAPAQNPVEPTGDGGQ